MRDDLPQLPEQIRQITNQLREVYEQLESAANRQVNLGDILDLETLANFKAALDHARHLVWPQILGLEQGSAENISYALQLYRMQRIREMLQVLQQDEADLGEGTKIQLFLAEIHRMLKGKSDA